MGRFWVPVAITVSIFITAVISPASTHYIAANGSDTNSGTSKSAPWLHAPGMPACASNCGAYTPAPGDSFIFRGGDTWHFGNRTASPYTGGTWAWGWSGTSGNVIYVGVDQTWYNGGSWVRPVLTADNPTSTNAVSSCLYHAGSSNGMVNLYPVRYVTFDNFELTGFCWDNTANANYIVGYGGAVPGYQNPFTIENLYLHGWTHTTAGTQAGASGLTGYNQNYGVTLQYNVIDGSDSDHYSLQPLGQGGDTYFFQYNIIRHVGGTSVSNTCHIAHDNLFEYIYNVTDSSTHTDIYMCYGEAGAPNFPGDGTPNLFYNNVFRNIPGAVSYVFAEFPPPNYTDYVFNNIFHDYGGNATNYNPICEDGTCGAVVLFNN